MVAHVAGGRSSLEDRDSFHDNGNGSIAVRFKNYHNAGTTSGTVAGTFTATSPTDITYTGTITYTRGTGRFKRVRGSGTVRCTTTDGGAHKACTVNSKVTEV